MATAYPSVPGVRFKLVAGFPDYCVGDDGSIWSRHATKVPRHGIRNNGWRQMRVRKGPRCLKCLLHGQTHRQTYVHRLVLEAFVGPCPPGMECCHNDGDPSNNALANLRWDTSASNNADKIRHGTWPSGIRNGHSKLQEDDIRAVRSLSRGGMTNKEIAERFGVTQTMIRSIVTGKNWKHVT